MAATRKGKSIWPAPVYVAQFAGGETVRMSYWQPVNKPLRQDAARKLACEVIGAERHRVRMASGPTKLYRCNPWLSARSLFEREARYEYAGKVEFGRSGPIGMRGSLVDRKIASPRLPYSLRNATNVGHEGATWQDGKLCVPIASDIIAGHTERKDAGHEGEIIPDPFFAPAAETVHRAKRAKAGGEALELRVARAALADATARIAELENALAWERRLTMALAA